MRIQTIARLALGVLFLAACTDETTVYYDDLKDGLITESSQAVLRNAIDYEKAGVLVIYEEDSPTAKVADVAGDYPLTAIASVSPPSYESGDHLTASHVTLEGDFAYVAYNTVGEVYAGAVDIVDISDPHNPVVTSRLFFPKADINSVAVENGYVYLAGGVDAELSVSATSNSMLARVPVSEGVLQAEQVAYGFQQGYNATDVVVEEDRILVSSGEEGSITSYSKSDLAIEQELFLADARSLASTPTGIAVLDAGTGVRFLDASLQETGLVGIATDLGKATKKTLAVKGTRLYVAEASKGTGVYDMPSGQLIEYMPIPLHPEGIEPSAVVTNAVVANQEAIFMANGGAGLSLSEETGNQVELVGILEIDGSVNYVESKGDYAFAASGELGLQIIRLNRPSESLAASCSGLPEYDGGTKVVVNAGEQASYSGSKRFNNVVVGGELLLCGTWTVANHVNLQPGGTLSLYGTMAVGRNSHRRNITVNEGSVLRIEGDVTIYGDLILNDGASVEFLGSGSVIDIYGQVKTGDNTTVTGTFRDVKSRF